MTFCVSSGRSSTNVTVAPDHCDQMGKSERRLDFQDMICNATNLVPVNRESFTSLTCASLFLDFVTSLGITSSGKTISRVLLVTSATGILNNNRKEMCETNSSNIFFLYMVSQIGNNNSKFGSLSTCLP